jgi:hypothetical protein
VCFTRTRRWIFVRRSVSYETGERLTPDSVTNVNNFTSYAQQELGLSLPIGNGRRQAWGKTLKSEMAAQNWAISDLVKAVDYVKANRKSCKTLNGIMWYVQDAREWRRPALAGIDDTQLHVNVSRALAMETDDDWARRLSLAKGRALVLTYARWRAERYGKLMSDG